MVVPLCVQRLGLSGRNGVKMWGIKPDVGISEVVGDFSSVTKEDEDPAGSFPSDPCRCEDGAV